MLAYRLVDMMRTVGLRRMVPKPCRVEPFGFRPVTQPTPQCAGHLGRAWRGPSHDRLPTAHSGREPAPVNGAAGRGESGELAAVRASAGHGHAHRGGQAECPPVEARTPHRARHVLRIPVERGRRGHERAVSDVHAERGRALQAVLVATLVVALHVAGGRRGQETIVRFLVSSVGQCRLLSYHVMRVVGRDGRQEADFVPQVRVSATSRGAQLGKIPVGWEMVHAVRRGQ